MSFADERKYIEKQLRDNFDSSIIPIQYENVATLKKGTETIKDITTVKKFIRLNITSSGAEQVDIGGACDRHYGIITVGIFVKAGMGSNISRKIADDIYYIFNRQSFNGILTRTSSIDSFPENEEGWYQVNVNTEFYRNEEFIPPVTFA